MVYWYQSTKTDQAEGDAQLKELLDLLPAVKDWERKLERKGSNLRHRLKRLQVLSLLALLVHESAASNRRHRLRRLHAILTSAKVLALLVQKYNY